SAWVALSAAAACLAKLLSLHDGDGRLVPAPPDGSWSLVQVGGLNQHGEIFGTMYLDSAAWGGGAFPFRDGIDLGGTMIGPGLRFSDVEQQENNFPFLYLWRREMPDSGGAGRHRGGNGIEYALALHGSDLVQGTLATHGAALPAQVGLFGGHPGSCAGYDLVEG